jgi:proteasome assembly chaperone (PAC2) family protein
MDDAAEFWEQPSSRELYMIAGWRQWADAGAMSSGLPQYLIKLIDARLIGEIKPAGFYLFQFPGTHDLVRPIVKFEEGYPESLQTKSNEIYFAGDDDKGIIIFLGDEPHLDAERYISSFLDTAESLGVRRIVSFGGVYGELPYGKERLISAIYSVPHLKSEMENLAVNLSSYHGGASIGSYICRRAGERGIEFVGLYGFVPTYDFSNVAQIGSTIRIENDYMAWFGAMRRINYMLGLEFNLTDLQKKSRSMVELIDAKVAEIDNLSPQLEVRQYMDRLEEEFKEVIFEPLDDVWEEELRRIFDEDSSSDS